MKRAENWIRAFTNMFLSLLRSPWISAKAQLQLRFSIVLLSKHDPNWVGKGRIFFASFSAVWTAWNKNSTVTEKNNEEKSFFPIFLKNKSVNKLTCGAETFSILSCCFLDFSFPGVFRNEKQFITVRAAFIGVVTSIRKISIIIFQTIWFVKFP